MKTLLLMRHAKSDWSHPEKADIDRPLNSRGRKAADLIAQWLKINGPTPKAVICSESARTRETLGRLRLTIEIPANCIKYEKKVYNASCDTLIEVIRRAPWEKGSVMLVGHNPGLEGLLTYLCDSDLPYSKTGKLFPTASIAVIELKDKIGEKRGKLIRVIRPKEITL